MSLATSYVKHHAPRCGIVLGLSRLRGGLRETGSNSFCPPDRAWCPQAKGSVLWSLETAAHGVSGPGSGDVAPPRRGWGRVRAGALGDGLRRACAGTAAAAAAAAGHAGFSPALQLTDFILSQTRLVVFWWDNSRGEKLSLSFPGYKSNAISLGLCTEPQEREGGDCGLPHQGITSWGPRSHALVSSVSCVVTSAVQCHPEALVCPLCHLLALWVPTPSQDCVASVFSPLRAHCMVTELAQVTQPAGGGGWISAGDRAARG